MIATTTNAQTSTARKAMDIGATFTSVRVGLPEINTPGLPYLTAPTAARSYLTVTNLMSFVASGRMMVRFTFEGDRDGKPVEHVLPARTLEPEATGQNGDEPRHAVKTRVSLGGRVRTMELVLLKRPARPGLLHFGRNAQDLRPSAWLL